MTSRGLTPSEAAVDADPVGDIRGSSVRLEQERVRLSRVAPAIAALRDGARPATTAARLRAG